MTVGEYKGLKVSDAKVPVKKMMIGMEYQKRKRIFSNYSCNK
jgi:hypothetical protein